MLRGRQLACSRNFSDFFVAEANDHILWLKVGVDDLAHPMNVVQTNQTLAGKPPDQRQRHSFVVVPLDDFQKVDAQDLENHNEVFSVWAVVDEGIQKLSAMGRLRDHTELSQPAHEMAVVLVVIFNGLLPFIGPPVLSDLVKDIHFIVGCLDVVLGTLLNFESDVTIES